MSFNIYRIKNPMTICIGTCDLHFITDNLRLRGDRPTVKTLSFFVPIILIPAVFLTSIQNDIYV